MCGKQKISSMATVGDSGHLQSLHCRAELEQTSKAVLRSSDSGEEVVDVGGDYLPRGPGHEDLLRLVGEGGGRARRGVGRFLRRQLHLLHRRREDSRWRWRHVPRSFPLPPPLAGILLGFSFERRTTAACRASNPQVRQTAAWRRGKKVSGRQIPARRWTSL